MRSESLDGRIERLERESESEPEPLPVLRLLPGDDHAAMLAAFIAQHGRAPVLTVVRRAVGPERG